jgi:hypothetical protein
VSGGREEAQKSFDRVPRDFSDQPSVVERARRSMAELHAAVPHVSDGPVVRRLWKAPSHNLLLGGPSPDDKHLALAAFDKGR